VLVEQLEQRHLAMEPVAAFERTTVSGKMGWSSRQRANAKKQLSGTRRLVRYQSRNPCVSEANNRVNLKGRSVQRCDHRSPFDHCSVLIDAVPLRSSIPDGCRLQNGFEICSNVGCCWNP